MPLNENSDNFKSVVVLDDLAHQIGKALDAAEAAPDQGRRNALRLIMDAGDRLNEARPRISTKAGWETWVRTTHHSINSARTADLYRQLADHRGAIESEMARTGRPLSVRQARKLIAATSTCENTETNTAKAIAESQGDLPDWRAITSTMSDEQWAAALAALDLQRLLVVLPSGIGPAVIGACLTDAEWTKALSIIGVDHFLRVCPNDWRAKLQARVDAQSAHNTKKSAKSAKSKRSRFDDNVVRLFDQFTSH